MSQRKTVFLHIGLPKTGTGFLQHTLHENHDAMAAAGLWCVRAGGHPSFTDPGNHLLPIRLFKRRRPDFRCAASATEIRSAWRLAIEEIRTCPCPSAFLSSELFALDVYKHKEIVAIRRHLRGFDARIVVVLRDPADFAHSVYLQRLRDGYCGTMRDYMDLLWPQLDWGILIERWSAVFGAHRIIPLIYNRHTRKYLLAYFVTSVFPGMVAPEALSPTLVDTLSIPASLAARVREINLRDPPDRAKALQTLIASERGRDQPADPESILTEDMARQLRENCRWPPQIAP